MKKLSVIIPIYNSEKYIKACLKSVCGQDVDELEILCVDDGSTDETSVILKRLAEKDGRIRVISQEHCGVSAARNVGLAAATGEYVAFMDADDFYPDGRVLSKLYRAAEKKGADICGGCFSIRDERTGKTAETFDGDLAGYVFESEGWVDYSDYQFDFGYHRFIYRREFLEKNGIDFPNYMRYQDPIFFVMAMLAAKRFYALSEVTYCYREGHKDSRDWRGEMWREQTEAMEQVAVLARDNGLDGLTALTCRRACHQLGLMYDLIFDGTEISEENVAAMQSFVLRFSSDGAKAVSDVTLAFIERIRRQKSEMEHSVSFRLGRTLTRLPRRLRDAIKK